MSSSIIDSLLFETIQTLLQTQYVPPWWQAGPHSPRVLISLIGAVAGPVSVIMTARPLLNTQLRAQSIRSNTTSTIRDAPNISLSFHTTLCVSTTYYLQDIILILIHSLQGLNLL